MTERKLYMKQPRLLLSYKLIVWFSAQAPSERHGPVRPCAAEGIEVGLGGRGRRGGAAYRSVHARAEGSAPFAGGRDDEVVLGVLEAGVLADELQSDIAHGTVAVLGNDDFGHAAQVGAVGRGENLVVVGAVDEADYVGVLLDGARLTQVAQLRTLALLAFAVLYTTVQLRQGDNGDVQLLGQSLERTRDGAHLFLTATERHAAGVHQLQVVDDDDLHTMFAHQSAGLGTQFEDGERRRVVHVERGVYQVAQLVVQLLPLVVGQLTTLDLLARYLADVRYQTVHQLHVAHFEREQGHGIVIVHGNVLGHGQHEGRLTHSRTGSDDDEVGVLPARGHLVQLREAALQSAQTVGTRGRLLYQLVGLGDDGVDLRVVLLHVLLRDFEELSFGLLHQVVHVERLVERFRLDVAGEGDELTRQRLLRDDAGVILDMGRRSHLAAELCQVEGAAHLFQFAPLGELFLHGEDVHRLLVDGQVGDGGVDELMAVFVERLRPQNLAYQRIGIFLYHQCAQYGLLQFGSLGLNASVVGHRLRRLASRRANVTFLFCHGLDI